MEGINQSAPLRSILKNKNEKSPINKLGFLSQTPLVYKHQSGEVQQAKKKNKEQENVRKGSKKKNEKESEKWEKLRGFHHVVYNEQNKNYTIVQKAKLEPDPKLNTVGQKSVPTFKTIQESSYNCLKEIELENKKPNDKRQTLQQKSANLAKNIELSETMNVDRDKNPATDFQVLLPFRERTYSSKKNIPNIHLNSPESPNIHLNSPDSPNIHLNSPESISKRRNDSKKLTSKKKESKKQISKFTGNETAENCGIPQNVEHYITMYDKQSSDRILKIMSETSSKLSSKLSFPISKEQHSLH